MLFTYGKNYAIEKECVTISINQDIFDKEIILTVAYMFTEESYVMLSQKERDIFVTLKPKKKVNMKQLALKFNNELLNYSSYAIHSKRTMPLRELLLQNAVQIVKSKK